MNDIPIDQSTDELLTAYLDGELDPREANELEHQLVHEESLRTRLAELRKTYDLLDEIHESPRDQRFTRSTLELVVHDLTRSAKLSSPENKAATMKRSTVWPWVVAGLFAIAVGSGSAFAARFMQLKQELGDLRMAANIGGLVDANDYPVLLELAKEQKTVAILRRQFTDVLIPAIPDHLSDRADWFQTLSPAQQARLATERDKLRTMNRAALTRFEAMQKRIEAEPNSAEIEETAKVISLVMDQMPHSERLFLERYSQENRLGYLREQMHRTAAIYYFSHLLSAEDAEHFRKWASNSFEPALNQLVEFYRGRDESRLNFAINRFLRNANTTNFYPFQDIIMPLLQDGLSEEANEVIKRIPKDEQLEVLGASLYNERFYSDSTLIDMYERTNSRFREYWDLGDPGYVRRILRDSRSQSR